MPRIRIASVVERSEQDDHSSLVPMVLLVGPEVFVLEHLQAKFFQRRVFSASSTGLQRNRCRLLKNEFQHPEDPRLFSVGPLGPLPFGFGRFQFFQCTGWTTGEC